MDDLNKQIPPPKSWVDFENLCHGLFSAIWDDPYAQKNGRSGQPQHGVDVFGSQNQEYGVYDGVQCKGKNVNYGAQADIEEIEREIAKAEKFSPALRHWIYATTAPVDSKLQEAARKISKARAAKNQFTVSVFGWEQIEFLLCKHKEVLRAFYPELGLDPNAFIEEFRKQLKSEVSDLTRFLSSATTKEEQSRSIMGDPAWVPVKYGQGRGLGPALMGRSMSASDAISCPQLPEVSGVIADLSRAYASRIVGEPGSGKSLSAFQAMRHFASAGWHIYKLVDPRREDTSIPDKLNGSKILLFIDDAHIMDESRLKLLEEKAGPDLYVLSTHNAEDGRTSFRNAIAIDSRRAVTTIANALMRDPRRTLGEVSKVDKDVGEKMMDIGLEDRISDAQERASYPWQFCFILGGGWRRASDLADAARHAKADIILAGLAGRQLISRDEPLEIEVALKLLSCASIHEKSVKNSIDWLVSQRLLLSREDLRTPHQRFAAIVLGKILQGQDLPGRDIIGKLLQHMLRDESYSLAGKRMLLHELRFQGNYGRWAYLVPADTLGGDLAKCWQASSAEERLHACYFLSELDCYYDGWPEALFKDHEQVIADWISAPQTPVGWGLARLIHGIGNQHREYISSIIEEADPLCVARAVNNVEVDSTAHLGELVGALGYVRNADWHREFASKLDRDALLNLPEHWPDGKDLWAFAKFCQALDGMDESLGLDLAGKFIPVAQKAYDRDPVEAFHSLHDMNMSVLRIYDPLGIYVGKLGPKNRHRQIARQMFKEINVQKLAYQISETRLRDMQSAAGLLSMLHDVSPAKYEKVIDGIDWNCIAETIGHHWDNLPHEAEVFLGVCYGAEPSRHKLDGLILANLERIRLFPPRIAIVSPDAAIRHVEAGKEIRIAQHDHVDWTFGPVVLALFAERKPERLESAVQSAEATASKTFSQRNHSWFKDAYEYINILNEVAPQSLERILDGVDVSGASEGWADSLKKGGGSAKTVAFLIARSLKREDKLGELAQSLRKRFPRKSVPPKNNS